MHSLNLIGAHVIEKALPSQSFSKFDEQKPTKAKFFGHFLVSPIVESLIM